MIGKTERKKEMKWLEGDLILIISSVLQAPEMKKTFYFQSSSKSNFESWTKCLQKSISQLSLLHQLQDSLLKSTDHENDDQKIQSLTEWAKSAKPLPHFCVKLSFLQNHSFAYWIIEDWITYDWLFMIELLMIELLMNELLMIELLIVYWISYDWIIAHWITYDWIIEDWITHDWIIEDWITHDWILLSALSFSFY